jgi:hypothetical protein
MVNIMNWRKSNYSGSNSGNCVEVADDDSRVLVRDTKDRQGPILRFTADAWKAFAKQLKSLARQHLSDPLGVREAALPCRKFCESHPKRNLAEFGRPIARSAVSTKGHGRATTGRLICPVLILGHLRRDSRLRSHHPRELLTLSRRGEGVPPNAHLSSVHATVVSS